MASKLITNSSDSSFTSDVLESSTPVVVDFWATWCGPCRAMAPHLDAIADAMDGKLRIVKVDVDNNQKTAVAYGIQSLPTLLIFKDGKPVDKLVGNPGSRAKIEAWVKNSL